MASSTKQYVILKRQLKYSIGLCPLNDSHHNRLMYITIIEKNNYGFKTLPDIIKNIVIGKRVYVE